MTIRVIQSSPTADIDLLPGSGEGHNIIKEIPSAVPAPNNGPCGHEAYIADVDIIDSFKDISRTRQTDHNQLWTPKANTLSIATEGPDHLSPRLYRSRSESWSSDATSDSSIRVWTPTSETGSSPKNTLGLPPIPSETASRQAEFYGTSTNTSSAIRGLSSFVFDFQSEHSRRKPPSSPSPTKETYQSSTPPPNIFTAPPEDYQNPAPIDHSCLSSLLSCLLQKIHRLVPSIYHTKASFHLDPSTTATTMDIVALSKFLGSILPTSCAPQRDAEIHDLVSKITAFRHKRNERVLCKVLEGWMEILERMEMVSHPSFKVYT